MLKTLTPRQNFYRVHAINPFVIFLIVVYLALVLRMDMTIADFVYAWQGNVWRYKEAFLLENVLHKGGRSFVVLLYVLTLLAFIASFFVEKLRIYRKGLAYVLLAVGLSSGLVSVLKSLTQVSCPWKSARYGGKELVDFWFEGGGNCFPAGHASGGYAWIALTFFNAVYFPALRRAGLWFGLGLGLVFGIAQQIRGAHYVGHDVVSLAISWFVALGLALAMFGEKPFIAGKA
jgi:membrane-associated PAP2 superfamily phosphatase